MRREELPQWLTRLEQEDLVFIRKFLLASGSLKEVAREYGVSYPTVRLRLDRLIEKVEMEEEIPAYIQLIRRLALDDKLDYQTAKLLIQAYREDQKEGGGEPCWTV